MFARRHFSRETPWWPTHTHARISSGWGDGDRQVTLEDRMFNPRPGRNACQVRRPVGQGRAGHGVGSVEAPFQGRKGVCARAFVRGVLAGCTGLVG